MTETNLDDWVQNNKFVAPQYETKKNWWSDKPIAFSLGCLGAAILAYVATEFWKPIDSVSHTETKTKTYFTNDQRTVKFVVAPEAQPAWNEVLLLGETMCKGNMSEQDRLHTYLWADEDANCIISAQEAAEAKEYMREAYMQKQHNTAQLK